MRELLPDGILPGPKRLRGQRRDNCIIFAIFIVVEKMPFDQREMQRLKIARANPAPMFGRHLEKTSACRQKRAPCRSRNLHPGAARWRQQHFRLPAIAAALPALFCTGPRCLEYSLPGKSMVAVNHAIRLKAALDMHQAVEAGGQQSRHQDEGDADGDFRRDQCFAQLLSAAGLACRA